MVSGHCTCSNTNVTQVLFYLGKERCIRCKPPSNKSPSPSHFPQLSPQRMWLFLKSAQTSWHEGWKANTYYLSVRSGPEKKNSRRDGGVCGAHNKYKKCFLSHSQRATGIVHFKSGIYSARIYWPYWPPAWPYVHWSSLFIIFSLSIHILFHFSNYYCIFYLPSTSYSVLLYLLNNSKN